MNAINCSATQERITGVIQSRRGILIKNKLKHLDLFSGIGGFSLGLEATGGFETVAFCDIEEFPRKVLKKHWPRVKQYNDIKELTYEKLKSDGIGSVDIITGGYPCQPFSVAGRKKGEQDPRHLWPDYFRLVKELRPTWVIGENVGGHIKQGLDTVLSDLESEGYSTRTFSISAASVGANHKRERVFVVAHTRQPSRRIESSRNTESSRRGASQETKRSTDTNTVARPSEGTKTMADSFSRNVEAGCERQREIRQGHKEEGIPDNVACGSEAQESKDVANTQGDGLLSRSGEIRGGESEWLHDNEKENRNEVRSETSGCGGLQGDVGNTDSSGRKEQCGSKSNEKKNKTFERGSDSMAHTSCNGRKAGIPEETSRDEGKPGKLDNESGRFKGWKREGNWTVEPDVGRVGHGIPDRVDRLKGLGNSLVPQIPYYIGLSILETYETSL